MKKSNYALILIAALTLSTAGVSYGQTPVPCTGQSLNSLGIADCSAMDNGSCGQYYKQIGTTPTGHQCAESDGFHCTSSITVCTIPS